METIKELILSLYEDNSIHFDFVEDTTGGECDCELHNAMDIIMMYWENNNE